MNRKHLYPCRWACLFAAAVGAGLDVHASAVASFDDIQFWTGAGAHRAAIVIDWDSTSATDAALAWGYRWNGQASGEDMLRAVLAADSRLFAKLSVPGDYGISVWGLGYDAAGDGQFALNDGTIFDADGVAITGIADQDPPVQPVDPLDWYREGWFTGVWSYGKADANPWTGSGWVQSKAGPTGRNLVDGAWDSWAFTSPIVLDSFAQNPMAAERPRSAGDFDDDGDVDGGDFLIWQRGLGLAGGASPSQGDANRDMTVDALDLVLWKQEFAGMANVRTAVAVVPEQAADEVIVMAICQLLRVNPKRRRCS
jgi:hypothetical protein